MLQYTNMNKEFNIETNESNVGVEAVLLQDHKMDGEIHHLPIAFIICTLTTAEQNYSTTDQE